MVTVCKDVALLTVAERRLPVRTSSSGATTTGTAIMTTTALHTDTSMTSRGRYLVIWRHRRRPMATQLPRAPASSTSSLPVSYTAPGTSNGDPASRTTPPPAPVCSVAYPDWISTKCLLTAAPNSRLDLWRRISTVMWQVHWPIRPILGFWGSKVYKNGRFPALDADEPPCKIWRR